MQPPILTLVAAGLAVAAAVLFYRFWYLWKQRRAQWEQAAIELGLAFQEGVELAQTYGHLRFFQRGRGHRTKIALSGTAAGASVLLADHRYTTGGGKNQSTHDQTLCVLTCADLRLPDFALRREVAVFDRLGELFGAQDIDFSEDPAFSKAFVLKGSDENQLRELFHLERRQRLLQLFSGRFHLEGSGEVLLFHTGRLVKPAEARDFVLRAGEILDVFRR